MNEKLLAKLEQEKDRALRAVSEMIRTANEISMDMPKDAPPWDDVDPLGWEVDQLQQAKEMIIEAYTDIDEQAKEESE